jgi:hypothetical protein
MPSLQNHWRGVNYPLKKIVQKLLAKKRANLSSRKFSNFFIEK